MTTVTYEAMLAPILADPESDTARLIMAEWLAEHEQEERAEFIRCQVELAKPCEKELSCGRLRSDSSYLCEYHSALRQRELELLAANAVKWIPPIERLAIFTNFTHEKADYGWLWKPQGRATELKAKFVRGFIGEVETTLALWLGGPCPINYGKGHHRSPEVWSGPAWVCEQCGGSGTLPGFGSKIVRQQPVTRVVAMDARPHYYEGYWSWFDDRRDMDVVRSTQENHSHFLPAAVYDLIDWTFDMEAGTTSLTSEAAHRSVPSEAHQRRPVRGRCRMASY